MKQKVMAVVMGLCTRYDVGMHIWQARICNTAAMGHTPHELLDEQSLDRMREGKQMVAENRKPIPVGVGVLDRRSPSSAVSVCVPVLTVAIFSAAAGSHPGWEDMSRMVFVVQKEGNRKKERRERSRERANGGARCGQLGVRQRLVRQRGGCRVTSGRGME